MIVDLADGTALFAHTGGGSTWFRFDGEQVEISFRSVDGALLYSYRMSK